MSARHRLHGPEARAAQQRLQGRFRYEPPSATPVNYAPAANPSRPLNLTPHKRG